MYSVSFGGLNGIVLQTLKGG